MRSPVDNKDCSHEDEEIEVVFVPHPYDAILRCMALLDEIAPGWKARMKVPYPATMARVIYAEAMRAKGRQPWGGGLETFYGVDAPGALAYGQLQAAWRDVLAGVAP